MKLHKILTKMLILSFLVTLLILTTISITHSAETMATLSLTVSTDKSSYYLRQKITIHGSLTSDGSPVNNALAAVEVKDPRDNPFYFRTVTIGNPSETWAIDITAFTLTDLSANPLTKTTLNSQVRAHVTIRNKLYNPLDVVTTITICDENLIPIYSGLAGTTLEGGEFTISSWTLQIPGWAKPGKALVFMNVYNNLPENQGVPYAPEKIAYFDMVRNPEAGPAYFQSKTTSNSSPGNYEAYFSAPPDRYTRLGTYTIHATGRISPAVRIYTTGTFTLESYACPPQAAFTYSPLQVYQNMTVTFDASSSSAEGFNDTITSYKWDFGDGTSKITKTIPTITHNYMVAKQYIVTLNVTDNEGLWSTTSKPIIVKPEFGPTANFTWSPPLPMMYETITFDASSSKLGWSAATQQFSPITDYRWTFGDGNITSIATPTITHYYPQLGNYTVGLTITDAVGRTNTINQLVEVLNITTKSFDVNGDGKIDIKDIFRAAKAYGSQPGSPNWDPACDVNKDGKVDIKDIFGIAKHYGENP